MRKHLTGLVKNNFFFFHNETIFEKTPKNADGTTLKFWRNELGDYFGKKFCPIYVTVEFAEIFRKKRANNG